MNPCAFASFAPRRLFISGVGPPKAMFSRTVAAKQDRRLQHESDLRARPWSS